MRMRKNALRSAQLTRASTLMEYSKKRTEKCDMHEKSSQPAQSDFSA